MPAGFLVADLLCLVTHGIWKADMFEAGVALFSKRSILGLVVDFWGRRIDFTAGEKAGAGPGASRHTH